MVKRILIVLLSIFVIVFVNGCYFVFWGQHKAMSKIQSGKELNLYECSSVYTMHMALWMFGWPLSPEAAKECFMLHFHNEDTVKFRATRGGIYKSDKIMKAVAKLGNRPIGSSIYVAWNGKKDYALRSPEHRAAIALNPCYVTKVENDHYEISARLVYPKYSKTPFDLRLFTITLHEGLFRYLQDRGWLSIYNISYIIE